MRHRCYRRLNQPGLERSLVRSLVLSPAGIITTITRAKFVRKPFEKAVTLAKRYLQDTKNLSCLRRLISKTDEEVAKKLVSDIAPKLKDGGGYSRIIKLSSPRYGDLVKTASISVVGFEKNPLAETNK